VAEKARRVAPVLPEGDADLLVPAAFLHDVGYSPAP
jgi:HD superfamily phosphodiesterase